MKNIFLLMILCFPILLTSCKDDFGTFYEDNRPAVPVTFPGTTTYGFNPYITKSIKDSTSAIEFTLSIPENSGRTIKEITRVSAGNSSINAGSVANATYIAQPIAGNGTSVKFTTTLVEFKSKSAANARLVTANGEIAFMFLVTLDNGETIIPVQVRVRLTP
ncbi:hypothetical protein BWI97_14095 [Siphonobacter sp. BAB-5405]|nr:hypothetical protein BWI97_14095 [Siphonobacter sp. BAB-5405]